MSPQPSLLLLLLLAVPVFSTTLFVISGGLICNAPLPYNVTIYTQEDDDWTHVNIQRTKYYVYTPYFQYNYTAKDTTDWGSTFELQIEIIHLCRTTPALPTDETAELRMTQYIGDFAINDGTHYINLENIDITDRHDYLPHGK